MDYTLANIDSDKRDRIINAAIKEFSLYPYEKASTNNIVKYAGISKGLLFHYFENKQELYEKLIGFVINKLVDKISSEIDWEVTDILERIKQLIIVKIKLSKVYPKMFDFIIKVMTNKNVINIDDVMNLYNEYGVDIQGLLGDVYTRNIDLAKFKDQENIDKSMNIIRWTMEKYSEEQIVNIDAMENIDFDKISNSIDEYINVLRKAFY